MCYQIFRPNFHLSRAGDLSYDAVAMDEISLTELKRTLTIQRTKIEALGRSL